MSSGVKAQRHPLNRAFSENIDDYKAADSPRKNRPKLKRSLSANVRLSIEEKRKKVNKPRNGYRGQGSPMYKP